MDVRCSSAIHSQQGWLAWSDGKGGEVRLPVARTSASATWEHRGYVELRAEGASCDERKTRFLTSKVNRRLREQAEEAVRQQNEYRLIEAALEREEDRQQRLNEEARRARAAWMRRTLLDFLVAEQANYQAAGQTVIVDQLSEACGLAQELGDDSLLRLDRIIHGLEG